MSGPVSAPKNHSRAKWRKDWREAIQEAGSEIPKKATEINWNQIQKINQKTELPRIDDLAECKWRHGKVQYRTCHQDH